MRALELAMEATALEAQKNWQEAGHRWMEAASKHTHPKHQRRFREMAAHCKIRHAQATGGYHSKLHYIIPLLVLLLTSTTHAQFGGECGSWESGRLVIDPECASGIGLEPEDEPHPRLADQHELFFPEAWLTNKSQSGEATLNLLEPSLTIHEWEDGESYQELFLEPGQEVALQPTRQDLYEDIGLYTGIPGEPLMTDVLNIYYLAERVPLQHQGDGPAGYYDVGAVYREYIPQDGPGTGPIRKLSVGITPYGGYLTSRMVWYVPEPASLAMLGLGLLLIPLRARGS